MPCSLQNYRQRIGRFNSSLTKQCINRKPDSRKIVSFKTRLKLTLIAAIYCSLILSLPLLFLQHQVQTENAQEQHGGSSSTAGCQHFAATHADLSTSWSCTAMSSYVWDPGSCDYTSSGSSLNIHHWTGGDTRGDNHNITATLLRF